MATGGIAGPGAISTGRNLPPPQVKFVEPASGFLSEDGYKYLTNLLNQLAQSVVTVQVTDNLLAQGATQATALPLSTQWSVVTGQRNGGTGVLLISYSAGQSQTVFNFSGAPLNIYPPPGAQIDALGVNAPYSLANNSRHTFDFISDTQIRS